MTAPLSIDLFCRVVDNYGDIGVCWRLARQLASDHAVKLRLIVDDLAVFHKIDARVDPLKAQQNIAGIDVLHWTDEALSQHYGAPAEAVIEAFACTLPDLVVSRMKDAKPVWIDFEYLTAETWVDECHAKPSPHPSTGFDKSLFFPGFSAHTGGLIRERDLIDERNKFTASLEAQNNWRLSVGLPPKEAGSVDVSLFCYPGLPLTDFKGARVFVPEGVAPELGGPNIIRFPFLSSPDYDRLLWTCDLNFVRGEDSWVRAILAGKPFIWQIYKQAENAHLVKLQAFLDLYMKDLDRGVSESLAQMHAMWNEEGREGKTASSLWDSFLPLLPQVEDHAKSWSGGLAGSDDCATSLISFIRAQKRI